MQAVCTKTAALLHLRTLLLLLMTHHEKTRLNVNRNRNPHPIGGGGDTKVQYPISELEQPYQMP